MFDHIAVIGLGMIGVSIAEDIRAHKLANYVTGIDPNQAHGTYALTNGLAQATLESALEATQTADLIIIAAPPSALESVAKSLKPLLKDGTLIMDVCSVKEHAISAISPHIPENVVYIPAHPIAGVAESGANAGQVGLFEQKRVILSPYKDTDEKSITDALNFWQTIGGACEIMDAKQHDLTYAYVSHLPQIVAYACCQTLKEHTNADISKHADALKAFLRIGGSSPNLWSDIAMHNREAITAGLHNFLHIITHMRAELLTGTDREEKPRTIAADVLLAKLFPRIIASTTISAVQLCEHKHEMQLFKYVGTGFADVSAPALEAPDDDIELISSAFAQISDLLEEFEGFFRTIFIALEEGDAQAVYESMLAAQIAHKHIMQQIA